MKSKSVLIVGGCVVSFSIGVLVGGRIVKRAIMRELVEQADEYFELYMIYMRGKMQRDLETVYDVVSEKAKQGDEKAVKLFLQLHKDMAQLQKSMNQTNKTKQDVVQEDDDDDDDLEI